MIGTQQQQLQRRMQQLTITENDLAETFVCSPGPGGQNVNKVATCVVLRHIPTGKQVKCSRYRSQKENRYEARCQLVLLLERAQTALAQARRAALEKRRRQQRVRPHALKERMLETKRLTGKKKGSRRQIRPHAIDE